MIEKTIFACGIAVFACTIASCNYALLFQEAEEITEDVLEVEEVISDEFGKREFQPYIHSDDKIHQILNEQKKDGL